MYRRRDTVFAKTQRRPLRWIALTLAVLVVLISVYTAFDDGRVLLLTQRVLVPDLPKTLEGITILHLSDLNGKRFGPGQKLIADALKNKRYTAVVITGDMVGKRGDMYPFLELLAVLDPTKPVIFIAGDSDPIPVGGGSATSFSPLADYIRAAQTNGATYLDAPFSISVDKSTIWFSDASQLLLDLSTARAAYAAQGTKEGDYRADVLARTIAARELMRPEDLHIVLTHNPVKSEILLSLQTMADDQSRAFARSVDLIVAGGTVGGQWKLPFIGPVWMGGWFPGTDAAVRFAYTGGSFLQYTTGGLGVSGTCPLPGFRLFNTPEMTLITFTSQMDEGVRPQ